MIEVLILTTLGLGGLAAIAVALAGTDPERFADVDALARRDRRKEQQ